MAFHADVEFYVNLSHRNHQTETFVDEYNAILKIEQQYHVTHADGSDGFSCPYAFMDFVRRYRYWVIRCAAAGRVQLLRVTLDEVLYAIGRRPIWGHVTLPPKSEWRIGDPPYFYQRNLQFADGKQFPVDTGRPLDEQVKEHASSTPSPLE